jgi:hypothetical protein
MIKYQVLHVLLFILFLQFVSKIQSASSAHLQGFAYMDHVVLSVNYLRLGRSARVHAIVSYSDVEVSN